MHYNGLSFVIWCWSLPYCCLDIDILAIGMPIEVNELPHFTLRIIILHHKLLKPPNLPHTPPHLITLFLTKLHIHNPNTQTPNIKPLPQQHLPKLLILLLTHYPTLHHNTDINISNIFLRT